MKVKPSKTQIKGKDGFAKQKTKGIRFMYSTQAIENIRKSLHETYGINLAFCVCDNEKFNSIVQDYRNNEITLERATKKALSTIIEQPGG